MNNSRGWHSGEANLPATILLAPAGFRGNRPPGVRPPAHALSQLKLAWGTSAEEQQPHQTPPERNSASETTEATLGKEPEADSTLRDESERKGEDKVSGEVTSGKGTPFPLRLAVQRQVQERLRERRQYHRRGPCLHGLLAQQNLEAEATSFISLAFPKADSAKVSNSTSIRPPGSEVEDEEAPSPGRPSRCRLQRHPL